MPRNKNALGSELFKKAAIDVRVPDVAAILPGGLIDWISCRRVYAPTVALLL